MKKELYKIVESENKKLRERFESNPDLNNLDNEEFALSQLRLFPIQDDDTARKSLEQVKTNPKYIKFKKPVIVRIFSKYITLAEEEIQKLILNDVDDLTIKKKMEQYLPDLNPSALVNMIQTVRERVGQDSKIRDERIGKMNRLYDYGITPFEL